MTEIWMDVDVALSEFPANIMPLLDDTDFKTREIAVAYNAAGMDLVWNFVTCAGAFTQTAVTPTTAGVYDWNHQGDGMYSIEIPASGGASINNDTEGFGWFTGVATGVLPWRSPIVGFRAAAINDALIESTLAAFLNKIADHVRRRTQANVEASSDGDTLNVQSEYGLIQQAQNSGPVASGSLPVRKQDGTSLGSINIISTAGAEPITKTGT